ncbi:P-loop containing nucleoside triphosphate hydrolase protein [Lactifluus volemus]|nr:P-loop containing nucleoside triphosphate hydrolase protein [Lactifluus volemus]
MTLDPPLSTGFVKKPILRLLVDVATRAIRMDLAKPRIKENDFTKVDTNDDGGIGVINARFKTRIRKSKQSHLEVHLANGDIVKASIERVQGRLSLAAPKRPISADVSRIRVIGREEPTNSELAKYYFLVLSLTSPRKVPLFVNIIWSPKNNRAGGCDEEVDLSCGHAFRVLQPLNDSQKEVVAAMVSTAPCDSLVIAHGKTTTIAAAASIWVDYKSPCWIVAQSNVGVKNIAEKLFQKGVKFKLIVSKDFLFEWHEHLYKGIEKTLIRSDELPLRDISMLQDCGLLRLIPVKSLVIDEASQIDVFEFMHLFYKFSKVLTKVCFFGDPKQLPPYGAETAELQTIFDIKHLEKRSHFLDTQYRLPTPLGGFISEMVYSGKLRSCHKIVDYSCIKFIDVRKGNERKKGSSYENIEEVHMVVRIARRYHQRGLEFCVITFYDPQRTAIIRALETEKLPSGCVFNVDSFQGTG